MFGLRQGALFRVLEESRVLSGTVREMVRTAGFEKSGEKF